MKRKVDTQEKRYFGGQVKALDTATRTIEVVANSGQVDRYNERVPVTCLDTTAFLRNPVVMWGHNYQEPPVGKALALRAEGDALIAEIEFAETEKAEDIYQLYRGGFLSAVSIGFRGKKFEVDKQDELLTWTKAELIEISCVPIPADSQALARRVKMLTEASPDPGPATEEKAMTGKERGAMADCMGMCDKMAALAGKMKATLGGMMEDEEMPDEDEDDMPMKPKGMDGKAAEDILAALKGVGEAITQMEVTA